MSGDGIRRRLMAIQKATGGGPDYQITLHPDNPASTSAVSIDVQTLFPDNMALYVALRTDHLGEGMIDMILSQINTDKAKRYNYSYRFGYDNGLGTNVNYAIDSVWKLNLASGPWNAAKRSYDDSTWDVYKLDLEE